VRDPLPARHSDGDKPVQRLKARVKLLLQEDPSRCVTSLTLICGLLKCASAWACRVSSMTILNARIGIGAPDGKWAFEVWGQNLADKGYFQVAFDAPFQGLAVPGFNNQIDSFVGDPRTFGATIRVKF
jgi:hypothetical protein